MILLTILTVFFSTGCQKLLEIKNYVIKESPEDKVLKEGLLLEKDGNYKSALALYKVYKEKIEKNREIPSKKLNIYYARALFKANKDKKACIIIEKLSEDDRSGCLEKLLAECYGETKQYKKIENINKKLIKKFPENSSKYLNSIGDSLKNQGEVVKAQAYYKKALSKNPSNATEIEGNLAQAMSQAGQDKNALSILKNLATKSDASKKIKMQLAEGYALSGDKEKAKGVLSTYLNGNEASKKIDGFISKNPWS